MVIYLFNCLTYIAIIKYGNFCCLVYLRITYYCKLSDVKKRGSFRKFLWVRSDAWIPLTASLQCVQTLTPRHQQCMNVSVTSLTTSSKLSVILSHEPLAGDSVICSNRTYLWATKFIHLTFFLNQKSIFISKNLTLMAGSF